MADTPPEGSTVFNDIAADNRRLVELAENDFKARAEADVVAKDDKELSVEGQRADFEINIKKAGRGLREQTITTMTTGAKMFVVDPRQQEGGYQTLVQAGLFARGLIAIWDASQDKKDIEERSDKFEARVRKGRSIDSEASATETRPKITVSSPLAGGPPGST